MARVMATSASRVWVVEIDALVRRACAAVPAAVMVLHPGWETASV